MAASGSRDARRDACATGYVELHGMAGQGLCDQAEHALRAETTANPARALAQLRAANRDLGQVFSNPTHAALWGNMTVIATEFPNFIRACKQYGLAKDIVEMHDKQIELFEKPLVLPNLLDYYGNVYIASDSTLKQRQGLPEAETWYRSRPPQSLPGKLPLDWPQEARSRGRGQYSRRGDRGGVGHGNSFLHRYGGAEWTLHPYEKGREQTVMSAELCGTTIQLSGRPST